MKCLEHPDREAMFLWGDEWVCIMCDQRLTFLANKVIQEQLGKME